jgi:hypothetical protein
MFLFFLALLCVLLVRAFPISDPPKEKEVIRKFYAHRAAYERLRDMLLEDKHLVRVASWRVQTTDSIVSIKPPAGSFPIKRYNVVCLGG